MVPASEMRMEVSIWDPPLIPAVPFRPALYLPLRPSLLVASLLPFLRFFHVRPLLRLLHRPVVLARLWIPISTLRFLIATVIVAMIFGPSLFLRPSLLLPILRRRTLLPIILALVLLALVLLVLVLLVLILLVLILRDGHPRRSQQQRSANPTHD
jgi:hypothetical protein